MPKTRIVLGCSIVLAIFACQCSDGGEADCPGCLIGDICFPHGVTNPLNPCQVCEFLASKTSWSDDDGADCDDGLFCNGADTCSGGACSQHAGDPCGDDGMFCNGTESCAEASRACQHTGNPCDSGSWCNETTGECVAACAGCLIQGVCLFDGQVNPLDPCQICDRATSTTSWSDNDGADCDDGTYCNGVDTCAGHTCTNSGNPCDASDACWEDAGGQCCSPAASFACNSSGDVAEYDSCGHEISLAMSCGLACQDGLCLCNPVAGTGCPVDHKCTFADDRTGCFPDGDKTLGQACTSPATGADDCVTGTYCLNGACRDICTDSPDTCDEGYRCAVFQGHFDDQPTVGLCVITCDPVTQDCLDSAEACYLLAVTGESSCNGVPAESEDKLQGDTCYGPYPDACYLDGCDKGYGANLPDNTCAFFCNPVDNWKGVIQGLSGDPNGITCESTFGGDRPDGPGASYECVYIQSFYGDTKDVPATIGMCVNPLEYGSCADFDWDQFQADFLDGITDSPAYCIDHPDRCLFHCISLATADTVYR